MNVENVLLMIMNEGRILSLIELISYHQSNNVSNRLRAK
jgi:hypothetical protein